MIDIDAIDSSYESEIAIIGIAGRFPGAKNIREFWQNLRDGVECVSFFTDQELETSGIDTQVLKNPNYIKAKAILEDADMFDASFFGFSPREAEIMDPQHRIFLECAWEALENAGYDSEKYDGSIGVYGGMSVNSYILNLYTNPDIINTVGLLQTMQVNDKDFLSTRTSYKLGLNGPSVNIQTACSSSLVAVHIACQSLLHGECDMALAGGVSIRIPQKSGYFYQEGGIASSDGHCRAFDAKAKGTVSGNGVGIVVLKRLADAIAHRDYIYAVIKGSAVNNDGSVKVGYTAPSIDGQAKVISEAIAMSGIEAETITYIECHGTGTVLGDPIEIAALTKAFSIQTEAKGFCAVGSVKTNIGHLDAAAGIAGLIKTVLALQHKLIPPSLNFQQPNPQIDFTNSPFKVNTTLAEWQTTHAPRRAGVSSFGIGGTNAHIILEEAPVLKYLSRKSRYYHLLVLSAKTESSLETATTNLVQYLQQHSEFEFANIAYTYQVGRRAFNHRRMLVCRDIEDAVTALKTLDPKRVHTFFQDEPANQSVAFLFPGQGVQYLNMALELYQVEPTFRQQIDICSELLIPQLGFDLRSILFPSQEEADKARQLLNQTYITQPALFVVEYALAKLWMEWGIQPQAMIGHSIGEYVAACLSGVFSLEDSLALVAFRGKILQKLPSGAMLSIGLAENEIRPFLNKDISLAAINGVSLCVVSGTFGAVYQLESQLQEKGVSYRRLHTSHGFHSAMVDPILEEFTKYLKQLKFNSPKIPFISNVTGTWITTTEATNPHYWVKHLRQTVLFADGIRELLREKNWILLEVGPGRTLSTLVERHPDKTIKQVVLYSLHAPQEIGSDIQLLLNTLGKLWLLGVNVNWRQFYIHEQCCRIPLPTYPFVRQRYWIEAKNKTINFNLQKPGLSKNQDIVDWFYTPCWKPSIPPVIADSQLIAEQNLCWLIFVDEQNFGSQFIKRLKQLRHQIITVIKGQQFAKYHDCVYTINPYHLHEYDALIKDIITCNTIPQKIVHLWNITSNSQTLLKIENLQNSQYLGFYSLLFIAQALGNQNISTSIEIQIVSNNMQSLNSEEVLCPEKATLLGPCKVIPQEYSNLTCSSIDIVVPPTGSWQEEKLINHLIGEFFTQSSDLVIAYRGNQRWIQAFESIGLDKNVESTIKLRKGGVYLITGGLGGIGLVVAEYLARTTQVKLILVGRSAFPKKEEWENCLLTHNTQEQIRCKIQNLQTLEKLGSEIFIYNADVADQDQMQCLINQIHEKFGQINGVIHTAGIAGGGMIQLKKTEAVESVFAPKIKGTIILNQILQDTNLDFLIICSSLASILGEFGQVDYCAANAFIDAFAHYKTIKDSTVTVSINWDTWKDIGMAKDTALSSVLKAWREASLNKGISPAEGIEVLKRIFCNPLAQIVVSTQNLQTVIAQYRSFKKSYILEELNKDQLSKSVYERPILKNPYVAPSNAVEKSVAEIWQDILGIEQVGIDDNFFELGGHSLLATQLLSRILNIYDVEITLQNLFDAPTINDLSLAIVQKLVAQTSNEIFEEVLGEM